MIPFLDLPNLHKPLLPAFLEAFTEIVGNASFIGGPHVKNFETAFAAFCQTQGCVGVANGTDALMLALRAVGVGPGDKVALPTYTFIATAEAVTMLGAVPCLVDVDPQTYTLNPEALKTLSGLKAVIPVHLYGQPADMQPILSLAKTRGFAVIEDCAQAHGATYEGDSVGSLGQAGCFSFYPGKNLGALGDAGAVVSQDPALLERIRCIANHGRSAPYLHSEPWVNSRLDAIQAAALQLNLPHLQAWNAARQNLAKIYDQRLKDLGITPPAVGAHRTHIYHQYVIQIPERQRLMQAFANEQIGYAVHYERPIHLQQAYRALGHGPGDFPVAEGIAAHCFSLPIDPLLSQPQLERVVQILRAHVRAGG